MKREIKFRGKRIDNGQWAYGKFATIQDIEHYILVPSTLGVLWVEVEPLSIGQFTGKKDAKGNDVYEGDYSLDLDENDGSYYSVFYCDKNCAFRLYYYSYAETINEGGGEEYSKELDVVDIYEFNDFFWIETSIDGNIHENPSLLK